MFEDDRVILCMVLNGLNTLIIVQMKMGVIQPIGIHWIP